MNTITCPTDPFTARFGIASPRTLATETAGITWSEFVERYSPTTGSMRLREWSVSPGTAGMRSYDGILDIDGRVAAFSTAATGPIAALTTFLHEAGHGVEILAFHQRPVPEGTATFVHCEHDGRRHWAIAISDSATDSALRAIIAGANILSARGR